MGTRTPAFILLAALGLSGGSATAQVLNQPRFFVWHDPPATYDPTDPYLKRSIEQDVWYFGFGNNAVGAANATIQKILNYRLVEPNGPINIILPRFGHDDANTDYDPDGIVRDYDTRFFYPSDRLPAVDGMNALLDTNFPIPPSGDGNTARAFKHPFIQNATASHPRLMQWMERFVAQYKLRQSQDSSIPDPELFSFDCEAIIAAPPDRNPVFMLSELAKRPTYWANTLVPGFGLLPGGLPPTLKNMYDQAKVIYGWPNDINDGNAGLRTDQMALHDRNRHFMVWWDGICQTVQNHVMERCAYAPIRAGWPNARGTGIPPQVGNYNDLNADGQTDATGWFKDRRVEDFGFYMSNPLDKETLPRGTYHTQFGGFMHHCALADPQNAGQFLPSPGRWFVARRKATGDVDSPPFYGMPDTLVDSSGYRLFAQQDLWAVPNSGLPCPFGNSVGQIGPCETPWGVTMRLWRQTAESIINSNSGMHSDRLMPWLEMTGTTDGAPQANLGYREPGETRAMLAMLRGKNIRHGLFWVDFSVNDDLDDLGFAWTDTRDQIGRVYANRVAKYTRTQSVMPTGGYSDATETLAEKTARLEFTLRNSAGNDRVVELGGKPVPVVHPAPVTQWQTVLTVDYAWPDTTYIEDNVFELNIECAVKFSTEPSSVSQTIGKVLLWKQIGCNGNSNTGSWTEIGTYTFNAPQSGSPDSRYKARVAIVTQQQSAIFEDCNPAIPLRSFVRLVHLSNAPFTSTNDLAQCIPLGRIEGTSCAMGSPAPQSDVNYDGVIDETDLGLYLDDWIMDGTAADLDLNQAVDGSDLETFVESYVTGT